MIIVTKDCTVFILAFHTFVQRLIHTVELPLTVTSLQWPPLYNGHLFWQTVHTLAGVTLQTFYLGKLDLLTVYLSKIDFLSVTDFSEVTYLGEILSSGAWICLKDNRLSLDSYPKVIAWGKRNTEVASQ